MTFVDRFGIACKRGILRGNAREEIQIPQQRNICNETREVEVVQDMLDISINARNSYMFSRLLVSIFHSLLSASSLLWLCFTRIDCVCFCSFVVLGRDAGVSAFHF
jgi:hypothetical protein